MANQPATYPMTRAKYEELKAELEHKKTVERTQLAQRLKNAIEMGDLKENADYIAAKEAQGFLEGRINELKEMIDGAVIIADGDIRTVTVVEEGFDDEETYQIVGSAEADPREGRISFDSPLGRALKDAKKGEKVRVKTPSGELVFTVVDVS